MILLEKTIAAIPSSWLLFAIAAVILFTGMTFKNNNFF